MQQLQPIGDSSVTPTKIRFTGGEAVFSKEDLLEARDLENKLSRVLKLAVFALGKILRAVHQRKYYLIDNENLVPQVGSEFHTPDTEKTAFEKWAKGRGLGHRYSYLMRLIKIADLYDQHQEFFDSQEEVAHPRQADPPGTEHEPSGNAPFARGFSWHTRRLEGNNQRGAPGPGSRRSPREG